MLETLEQIRPFIGHTPFKSVDENIHFKLEYFNLTGSVKDRAAFNILKSAIHKGIVNADTYVIESSSGNFAIALATLCRELGLKFIAVIDPNITELYERSLRILAHDVVKVTQLDETGGYLLNRIKKVEELCSTWQNTYWPNQYENPDNFMAYYNGLADEIISKFTQLEFLFVSVSSGGTITGLSRRLKEHYPQLKVIGVDVKGSVIFGDTPAKRYISGIGSSKIPPIIKSAIIDDFVLVRQTDIIKGCHMLLQEYNILAGASSGAAYFAMRQVIRDQSVPVGDTKLVLVPDKGTAYLETIYNPAWILELNTKTQSDHRTQQFSKEPLIC